MASLYLNYPMDSACPFHRFLLPARFCREAFPKSTIEVGEGLPAGYDIYAMHGLLSEVALIEIARLKRRSGAKFIWSVDDDWKSIPDWNPAKPSQDGMAMYDLAKTMADWILCSTPHLASTFSDVSEKVIYAPNLLDLDQFLPRPYTMEGDRRNYSMSVELPIRVVWAGGSTHREDVAIITESIDQLIRTHRRKIAVVYQGMAPPPKLLTEHLHRGLFHQPPVPFASYQQILNSIKADVYLAPLAPVEFNLSKCVIGSTLVPTEKGIKKISDLVSGMAKTVRLETRHQTVRTWFQYKDKPTIRLETAFGYSIEGTPHHRIKDSTGEWKPLEDFSVGDQVGITPFDVTQRDYQIVQYPMFLATGYDTDLYELQHEMMMPRIVVNENWGRFFGYLMGDGHVNPGGIGISCSTEYPDVISDVKRLFSGMGLRTMDVLKGDARRRPDLPPPKGIDVRTSSVHLRRLMEYLGVAGLKGKVFEIPQVILDSPKSVIREFLRGLFEADGTVAKDNPSMSFTSKSEEFARQVHVVLLAFGIRSRLTSSWNKRYQRYYWTVQLGRQGCDVFNSEIGFVSQKKNERLRDICSRDNSNAYKEWEWSDKVSKLSTGTADVYDIEVAHDHYYLANGFSSHNSNLRVMEGWALMTAPVASAWGEYGCIRNGIDGRLAQKPDEWLSALNRLVTDHEYRLSLAAEGRQRVEAEYAWNNPRCREPWYKAFSKILGEDPVLA